MNKFDRIKSRNDLADFLGVPLKRLTYILYIKGPDNYYSSFEIPKKNKEPRLINAPNGELKELQRKLSHSLWDFEKQLVKNKKIITKVSHGFEKEKSIITNAKVHVNKNYVLNLDLEDFFESFHFGRVRGYFEKNRNFKLPIEVATIIAQLACYKGRLPQGAPSSPIITNLICNILDMNLVKKSRKFKLDYTRYADDLTFSTNDKCFLENKSKIYNEIKNEIERFGLSINDKKTRLIYKDSRQEVTGLIVNEKVNINRDYYKKTRAMANNLYVNGKFEIEGIEGSMNQLEGRFAFINQLDIYNNKIDSKKHDFRHLSSREKEYQKFLFYKHFIINDKPMIITEGKTDILYLKSAMRKYYKDYPELIENKDGKYEYKVMFLKRRKNNKEEIKGNSGKKEENKGRLEYFLGISEHGGDSLKNIYFLYKNKKNENPNIGNYFLEEIKIKPKNPVFLIFDNEQVTEKPLKKFLKGTGINKITKLSHRLYYNLYILINPILNGRDEAEIEDLFEESILNKKINGRMFSREDNLPEYYGKNEFSYYVYDNYEEIDFKNFIPMLDEMKKIINEYKEN